MKLADCQNVNDIRALAARRAHKMVFDYIDGGAGDEQTLHENTGAFAHYDLLFRALAGVDTVETGSHILGHRVAQPFFCSPAAGNRLFHTQGERAVARAAAERGLVYCLSTLSSVSIEDIAALRKTAPQFFQLYVWKDRVLVKEMLDRAKAAGFAALILTVDFPVTGKRERDVRNGFAIPPKLGLKQVFEALKSPAWSLDYLTGPAIRYANLSADTPAMSLADFVAQQLHAGFAWKDAEWLLGEWNGPAIIKGVVRTDDAVKAVETGFDAVMVSNHGGRQLDRSPAPVSLLPEMAAALDGRAELILDGGARRGVDILTALALGAQAVGFARPYLYGLAAAGHKGVARMLDILTDEFRRDMALIGARSVSELEPGLVRRRPETG